MKKDIEKEFLTAVDTSVRTHSKKMKNHINQKKKGNSGELELVHILNNRFGNDYFMRSPMSGAYVGATNRTRAGNMNAELASIFTGDVVPKSVAKNFKFSIEHKFYKEASFWDLFNEESDPHHWFEQASSDAASIGKLPMLIVKYNNHNRIVYIKNDCPLEPIFTHRGWKCYNLQDLLSLDNSYFFS